MSVKNLVSDLPERCEYSLKSGIRISCRLSNSTSRPPPWFTMPLADKSFEKNAEDRCQGIVDPAAWQDILAAVEELHRLGFVHRDLKPANVLLVEGKWVLADFGLILPMARNTTILTSSRSAYGSHYYAAPEQASDLRNTPEQADIFALGCILHDTVGDAECTSAVRSNQGRRNVRPDFRKMHRI